MTPGKSTYGALKGPVATSSGPSSVKLLAVNVETRLGLNPKSELLKLTQKWLTTVVRTAVWKTKDGPRHLKRIHHKRHVQGD